MTITAQNSCTEGFLFALLFAPLTASVVIGIPLLLIFPLGLLVTFAPILGYKGYLLVGGPLLWLSVKLTGNNPFCHICAALIAVTLLWPLTQLCLLYTSPSPRDRQKSRMPSSA